MCAHVSGNPLRFDGCGVNAEGGRRIATLTDSLRMEGEAAKQQYGQMLSAAPDLLQLLVAMLEMQDTKHYSAQERALVADVARERISALFPGGAWSYGGSNPAAFAVEMRRRLAWSEYK